MSNNNQPKETLTIKIGLTGTFWDKRPEYSVVFNGKLIERSQVGTEQKLIEFPVEVEENSTCKLEIRLENKEDSDTIENNDKTIIIKDLLLNIESIEIDDISLEQLIWDASNFIPDDPARPVIPKCVNLGWNGAYTLEFTSPFYLWLLENI